MTPEPEVYGFTPEVGCDAEELARALRSLPRGFCRNPFRRRYEHENVVGYDQARGWVTDDLRHWRDVSHPEDVHCRAVVFDICERDGSYDVHVCIDRFATSGHAYARGLESRERTRALLQTAREQD